MTGLIRPATPDNIAEAGRLLAAGRLVAFPTETVYGLGADAGDDRAVAAIFAAKNRPRFNPLIVHVADIAAADPLVEIDARARALMDRFWPGPLTLVLPRRKGAPISLLASAGLDSLAVRLPDHPVARAVIEAAARPLAAPSANASGAVSPTRADHVAQSLGAAPAMILDGGPCRVGIESTVLDLAGDAPLLLRPGGIPAESLADSLGGMPATIATMAAPRAPGLLESHYAPGLPVRLNAIRPNPGEALLAFGPAPDGATLNLSPDGATLNLSPDGDLVEAAANLFAMLRALDQPDYTGIAVMPIPATGLGAAINDRLRRAAHPRRQTEGAGP